MCRLIRRSYEQRLFTSTQGTFSQRIDDHSFIITPNGMDRNYIEPENLVRIEYGRKELGKNPSRSVLFHQAVYNKYPDVNSIIITQAPNIMSFAITDAQFDSRTIPESYIVLRNVQRMPFGSTYLETDELVNKLSLESPAVIVDKDCALVIGDSLMNAFDRLEVLEYSANALIQAKAVGDVVMIDRNEVEKIHKAFHIEA